MHVFAWAAGSLQVQESPIPTNAGVFCAAFADKETSVQYLDEFFRVAGALVDGRHRQRLGCAVPRHVILVYLVNNVPHYYAETEGAVRRSHGSWS